MGEDSGTVDREPDSLSASRYAPGAGACATWSASSLAVGPMLSPFSFPFGEGGQWQPSSVFLAVTVARAGIQVRPASDT